MTAAEMTYAGFEMTEDEYLRTLSHSTRFEFSDGLVMAKRGPLMTRRLHISVANELTLILVPYARTAGGFAGQTPTSNLSRGDRRLYRIPDLGYWAPGRDKGQGIFTPPTLAIEIVSPDQDLGELRAKCQLFLDFGVEIAWLVHPRQAWVEVWEDLRAGERLGRTAVLESPRLPDLQIELEEFFTTVAADSA